jgi:o-succinylbenzoate---CoA ligase
MLIDWLCQQALSSPEKIGLIAENQGWNYRAMHQQVNGLAEQLAIAGVNAGQHVAALLPNCPEAVFLVHALARLEAVLVPLNIRHSSVELSWQIDQADCAFLVHNTQTQVATQQIESARLTRIDLTGWNQPQSSRAQRSNLDDANVTVPGHPGLERTQAIVFTSGTSGKPKGARLTFGNHFFSAIASAFRLGVEPKDCWLATLPLFHVGGLAIILRSCLYGTTLVLQDRFDPNSVLQAITDQNISLVSLTPTMLHRLLELPGSSEILARLRIVLLGGAAAPQPLLERALAAGINLALTYGMTETATQIATTTPDETRLKPGSVGKPLLFCQVRILDEQGNPLPARQTGVIAVSGPTVMPGYYNQENRHPGPTSSSEFITGDLGYMDPDGDLWVVQRREDLIVSGGENVYPVEVETVLLAHPGIESACVVGLDDPEWGQRVAAAIVPRRGFTLDEAGLVAYCRSRLAGYKIPRQLIFLERLPQTESGKVLRQQVLALLKAQIET